ncbi:hypothetical protein C4J94_5404 [Pseudomonas sp. R5-89-07]|nr:hypothetical protein C4J94_5404 [Pseudomonas sp. R5-89-07]
MTCGGLGKIANRLKKHSAMSTVAHKSPDTASIYRPNEPQVVVGAPASRYTRPCKRKNPKLEGLLCQNAVGRHPADLAEFPFSSPYEKRIERCMLVLKRFSRRRLST